MLLLVIDVAQQTSGRPERLPRGVSSFLDHMAARQTWYDLDSYFAVEPLPEAKDFNQHPRSAEYS